MNVEHVRILLVASNVDDVAAVRGLLAGLPDEPYGLVHVEFLSEAQECCALGRIDVVLLDLSLPDSRGLETFLALRAKHEHLPLIVLADPADEAGALEAVEAGAEDYLVKGRVDQHVLIRSIRYAIERGRRRRAEHALRLQADQFQAAEEIRRRLVPAEAPTLAGLDIAGAVFRVRAGASDYYDHFPLPDGSLAIAVGDVSSRGTGPTLVMAELRACLRTLVQTCSDVGEILSRVNRFLTADVEQLHSVSMALVRLDGKRRALVYASAGQRGYLIDPARRRSLMLEGTSPPLGINNELQVPVAAPIALQTGQLAAFVTDGVTEALSPEGGRFGSRHTLAVLHEKAHLPAQEIADALHVAVRQFCAPDAPRDDLTVVIIKATQADKPPRPLGEKALEEPHVGLDAALPSTVLMKPGEMRSSGDIPDDAP